MHLFEHKWLLATHYPKLIIADIIYSLSHPPKELQAMGLFMHLSFVEVYWMGSCLLVAMLTLRNGVS